jgi:hypothetical protein
MNEHRHRQAMQHDAATAEHRRRLERLARQARRAREAEMGDVATNVIGVAPEDVARALRGVLTEHDER